MTNEQDQSFDEQIDGTGTPSPTTGTDVALETARLQQPVTVSAPETEFLLRVFLGPQGLRAGWSIAVFVVLLMLFSGLLGLGYLMVTGNLDKAMTGQMPTAAQGIDPVQEGLQEGTTVVGLLGSMALMALIERRQLKSYYLGGGRRIAHFVTGLVVGFVALSGLIGLLEAGHWITFGPIALSGAAIAVKGGEWAAAFLMVALFEEGCFRCYLLFTLTRGFSQRPIGFWLAAVATSALFGAIHLGNSGETRLGIASAAAIGFVFCMSVRWTGSAWWAIGFHAAWDWAQTFVYGTADSGVLSKGHLLTTMPRGDVLWSGGATGPEGSWLVIPVTALVALALWLVYGRRSESPSPVV